MTVMLGDLLLHRRILFDEAMPTRNTLRRLSSAMNPMSLFFLVPGAEAGWIIPDRCPGDKRPENQVMECPKLECITAQELPSGFVCCWPKAGLPPAENSWPIWALGRHRRKCCCNSENDPKQKKQPFSKAEVQPRLSSGLHVPALSCPSTCV